MKSLLKIVLLSLPGFMISNIQAKDIYFVTGNKGKLAEIQAIIPSVKQLNIDLEEIQEIDAKKVIEAKIKEAFKEGKVPANSGIFVEDTSLYLDALKGLPGPLIKWFDHTIGNEGLYKIAQCFGNFGAKATSWIGYSSDGKNIQYFEGTIPGIITAPSGTKGFGWDPIFKPAETKKTFAEMEKGEKNEYSMRGIAAKALRDYLIREKIVAQEVVSPAAQSPAKLVEKAAQPAKKAKSEWDKLLNKTKYSLTIKWLKSPLVYGNKKIVKTETLNPGDETNFETDEFSAEFEPAQAPTELKNKALVFKTNLSHLLEMEISEKSCGYEEPGTKKAFLYGCVGARIGSEDWQVVPKLKDVTDLLK